MIRGISDGSVQDTGSPGVGQMIIHRAHKITRAYLKNRLRFTHGLLPYSPSSSPLRVLLGLGLESF